MRSPNLNNSIDLNLSEKINENDTVWKYMSFPSFVSLLMEENLLFRRLDKFSDKLEGTMPKKAQKDYRAHLKNLYLSEIEVANRVNSEIDIVNHYKSSCYANCWNIEKNENYAMWKIYLDNHKEGIAIKSTINCLKNSIIYDDKVVKNNEVLIIKDVFYGELSRRDLNKVKVYTTKYSAYEYEKELRLFFHNQRDQESKDKTKEIFKGYNDLEIKYLKVDLKRLIKSVKISPFAGSWFYNTVELMLNEKFKDLELTIEDSEIEIN